LFTLVNTIQILAQPIILKLDAGIRIGLRGRLGDQWLDRLKFTGDPCQCSPLTVRVGDGKLHRQCSCKQS
jgi:hypothetical protein